VFSFAQALGAAKKGLCFARTLCKMALRLAQQRGTVAETPAAVESAAAGAQDGKIFGRTIACCAAGLQ